MRRSVRTAAASMYLLAAACGDDAPGGDTSATPASTAVVGDGGGAWSQDASTQLRDARVELLPVSPCAAGRVACGGRCIDPYTDADHCGAFGDCVAQASGTRCRAAESCLAGRCQLGCSGARVDCEGRCVDPAMQPCLRWGEPVRLLEGEREARFGVTAELDPQGNALVVALPRRGPTGAASELWARRYDVAADAWLTPQTVSLPEDAEHGPVVGRSALAFGTGGDALLVFGQLGENQRAQLWSRRYDAAADAWGAALAVKQDPVSGDPEYLWWGSTGDALVVWRRYDDIHSTHWWNRYDATTRAWGQEGSLEIPEGVGLTAVADDAGDLFVVWNDFGADGALLRAKRFDAASGVFDEPVTLSPADASLTVDARAAIDPAGNVSVTWQGFDASRELWWNGYEAASGAWQGPVRVASHFAPLEDAPEPRLDANGDVHIAWASFEQETDGIYYRRRSRATGEWEPPVLLSDSLQARQARVGVDADGLPTVLWMDYRPPALDLWATHADVGGRTWALPRLLEDDETGDVRAPLLRVSRAGPAIALWVTSGERPILWAAVRR